MKKMTDEQARDEFFRTFESKVLDIKYQAQPVSWREMQDARTSFRTQRVYVLEIPEHRLADILRWAEYMNRYFAPDVRGFFLRWWESRTQEKHLRDQNPAVRDAWNQYQMMLQLASSDPEKLQPSTDIPE
jgi:hypothetical protein